MALLIVKRGRYYTGTSSCTGFPDKHSWTAKEADALRLPDWEFDRLWYLARNVKGKLVGVENTKAEAKQKGRYLTKWPNAGERNRIYKFPESTKPYRLPATEKGIHA